MLDTVDCLYDTVWLFQSVPDVSAASSHLPTFKQLRYFVAFAEHKHFGRAAAECFVSQSAFSIAIQELEALLGANLVDRTNRRVTITATGKDIAVLAKLCFQRSRRRSWSSRAAKAGRCRARCSWASSRPSRRSSCRECCPRCGRAYPELKLFLHEDVTERLHAAALEGTLDVVLLALPYELDRSRVDGALHGPLSSRGAGGH